MMDSVKVAVTVLLAVSWTAAAAAPGVVGIAPGLHRRLDGAGFTSPQEDDFFADYKDLVTPPKDLLETPKDLLDTPKDLVETPEDLVETPKDLTDTPKDLLDEDLEEYAQHGSSGAQQEEEVDSSHPNDDDTAAHDEKAELSLAKHLKGIDVEGGSDYDHDAPAKTEYQSQEAPAKTAFLPKSPFKQASPYDQADVRSPYAAVTPAKTTFKTYQPNKAAAPVREYHTDPSASLRTGFSGGLGHRDGQAVRPEYAYRYGVHDPTTRDVKSAWEQRDGDATRGGYAVMEPDGHTRVVEYSVTKKGGFNARVKHLPPGHHGR